MEVKSVYPAMDISRIILEDEDGSQKMVLSFHSIVRFKNDLTKGTMLTLGTSYDLPIDIEESYPIELQLSTEFHRLAIRVNEEGVDVLKELNIMPDEFDVDDPGL